MLYSWADAILMLDYNVRSNETVFEKKQLDESKWEMFEELVKLCEKLKAKMLKTKRDKLSDPEYYKKR